MPKILYKQYKPNAESRSVIEQADVILQEYADDGFNLTVRQLYYQFIARDLLPDSYMDARGTKNNVASYNKLKGLISKAREAGMIDWNHITDRGRTIQRDPHWVDPQDFISSVAPQFGMDIWADQDLRLEVWVEKDALFDVVGRACRPLDVPYMACKGYMSASAMWEAANNRFLRHWNTRGQRTVILHLGDHDPSGIDMTRDIFDRMAIFTSQHIEEFKDNDFPVEVNRIALTMNQVEEYQPPPNPAKETDPRSATYRDAHGNSSWELDALTPQVIVDLITDEIGNYLDRSAYDNSREIESIYRVKMEQVADNWEQVSEYLDSI